MAQLSNERLKEIILDLKDSDSDHKKKGNNELVERLSKLRRNLLISSGSLMTFLLAGIEVQSMSLGLIRGSIRNPEVIPLALTVVYAYYFILYTLVYKKFKTRMNLALDMRSKYLERIAKEISIVKAVEIIEDRVLGSYTHEPYHGADELITLSWELDRKVESSDKVKYLNKLSDSGHFQVNNDEINFKYVLSDNDIKVFKRYSPFTKKMESINLMDYQIPFFFGILTIPVILYELITWIITNI